jgi:formylglycine-generating enzyme required for sulfatase activity
MKMRSRLLGIIALAAVALAATQCRRAKRVPATVSPPTAELPGFALIPAGEFTKGDSLDGDAEAPPHPVNVSAFYMGQKEVTKAEWDSVRTWAVSHGYPDMAEGAGKAAEHPVHTVSWWDVVKWCNARSEQEGLTPCYTVGSAVMRSGTTEPSVNWVATGYRLPTEAEWEKAARGGLSGKRFPWGDTISHTRANFNNMGGETYQTGTTGFPPTYGAEREPCTAPVGSYASNGYGLYDLSGNVWEWCWDSYEFDGTVPQVDPSRATPGSDRVVRGGAYNAKAGNMRCAHRVNFSPDDPYDTGGFRLARSSVPK